MCHLINDIAIWALSLAVIILAINLILLKKQLNIIYKDFHDKIKYIEQKIQQLEYESSSMRSRVQRDAQYTTDVYIMIKKQKQIIAELCDFVYKDN
jgi:uncharacterized protein YoxC